MSRISDPIRKTNNGGKICGMMEDNAMRAATETQEDENGGAVKMYDNGYGRQGFRWRWAEDHHGGVYLGK